MLKEYCNVIINGAYIISVLYLDPTDRNAWNQAIQIQKYSFKKLVEILKELYHS